MRAAPCFEDAVADNRLRWVGPMAKDEFVRLAQVAGVRPAAYDLDGSGDRNERYVLTRADHAWVVFDGERGVETGVRRFVTQGEALDHLLATLRADPTTRSSSARHSRRDTAHPGPPHRSDRALHRLADHEPVRRRRTGYRTIRQTLRCVARGSRADAGRRVADDSDRLAVSYVGQWIRRGHACVEAPSSGAGRAPRRHWPGWSAGGGGKRDCERGRPGWKVTDRFGRSRAALRRAGLAAGRG